MNLKYTLKSLGLFLVFIPFVLSSECDKIDKDLLKSITECSTTKDGKINKLTISNVDLTEKQVNKLLSSYDLTDLSYNIDFEGSIYSIPKHSGYSEIPTAINKLKNLETLNIHYNLHYASCSAYNCNHAIIITMRKNILKNLKKLKVLDIRGIKISQDNINDISTLDNLESLSFDDTYLDESLNYKPIGDLKKLNKLIIKNNHDSYYDLNKKYYHETIPKDLVISNKGIKELSMILGGSLDLIDVDHLPNLEKLSFTFYNHGKGSPFRGDIEGDLSKFKNLKSLDIYSFNINEEFMNEICNLKNLNELYIKSCGIGSIPECINSSTNLEILHLPYNSIETVNGKINNLVNLKSLDLSNNRLTLIDDTIGYLKNLKYLDLSYNELTKISERSNNLENLEYLDLSSNSELENLSIGNLKKLENLDLTANEIGNPKDIGNLTKLEQLILPGNNINELPKEFENLKNLKILNLEHNELMKFPEQIAKLEKLEKLDLNSNKIDDEIPKSYNNLSKLTEIKLFNNEDIRGETLTNDKLVVCEYYMYYDNEFYSSLCRHGNEICLDETSFYNYYYYYYQIKLNIFMENILI
ncbi:RNI-like protein [Anaeromyces robustus]|uniref:RNI-like protein n=1 Tax=Anaeromyces robustus TaxID=1754192 RepID=A0A1Y1X0N7_9FUNG|nr:RNI-like protein [Anaeromyces robustus]|eukprot:ORX79323.1 RNI-like protein [Anaeromyces robustus]